MLEKEPARERQGENVLGSENGKSSGEERGTEKRLYVDSASENSD